MKAKRILLAMRSIWREGGERQLRRDDVKPKLKVVHQREELNQFFLAALDFDLT
jgi:hypothetical protein